MFAEELRYSKKVSMCDCKTYLVSAVANTFKSF